MFSYKRIVFQRNAYVLQGQSIGDEKGAAYSPAGSEFTIAEKTALGLLLCTRSLDYPVSPLNRVLVQHALIRQGISGARVAITSGLPVDQYYQDVQPNNELIAKKNANIKGEVQCHNEQNLPAIIKKSMVMSEVIAAFFDVLMNEHGRQAK